MGQGEDYPEALMKALTSSHIKLPKQGEVFFSLRDKDKPEMLTLARELQKMGYSFSATTGTAKFLNENGISALSLRKVHEGRPNCVDHIRGGKVAVAINTVRGKAAIEASFEIRKACIDFAIPSLTESDAAEAFVLALKSARAGQVRVHHLNKMISL
jgi:carbamoyl-phosphate synthase large subunit